MSSERRSRPAGRPRRRPVEEEYAPERPPSRDPRRRTSYVPRDDVPATGRPPARQARDDDDRSAQRPPSRRQRPQQPPYRSARQQPADDYEAYDDYLDVDEEFDDRVIPDDRAYRRESPARQRGQAPQRPAARRSARLQRAEIYDDEHVDDDYDRFDDGFIDEEDWYEEEAAAGAYRPRQRGAARGAGRSIPRPSVSLPRPSLPRPTVPASIRGAALVQDQTSLLLVGGLLLSTIAMALLAINRVDSLAPSFATRISASGIPEAFKTEDALWQLPLMGGALLLMNVVAGWFVAPYSPFSARFLLIGSVLVQALIWVALFRLAF